MLFIQRLIWFPHFPESVNRGVHLLFMSFGSYCFDPTCFFHESCDSFFFFLLCLAIFFLLKTSVCYGRWWTRMSLLETYNFKCKIVIQMYYLLLSFSSFLLIKLENNVKNIGGHCNFKMIWSSRLFKYDCSKNWKPKISSCSKIYNRKMNDAIEVLIE